MLSTGDKIGLIVLIAMIILIVVVVVIFVSANDQTTNSDRPDLRVFFAPYVGLTDGEVEVGCEEADGEWHWSADYVGCSQMSEPLGVVICYTQEGAMAGSQCNELGGEWLCDNYNFYCKYPDSIATSISNGFTSFLRMIGVNV